MHGIVSGWLKLTIPHSSVFSSAMVKSVCFGTACLSELPCVPMQRRCSSKMLLHGAFCSLAWQIACTNPITYWRWVVFNADDASGCGGFWGEKPWYREMPPTCWPGWWSMSTLLESLLAPSRSAVICTGYQADGNRERWPVGTVSCIIKIASTQKQVFEPSRVER